MMVIRESFEAAENQALALYAIRSSQSQGRHYPEEEHPYRMAFQRDRDRILHSTSFRRLQYKTQVYITQDGDYYRTRLTHTLEVSQIARTLGRMLKVNDDLVEAIALAHDLGHTPFGHAGEYVLNRWMAGHGGFEHNSQGLRVVDFLECKSPQYPGLNLTYEVREGILKHAVFEEMNQQQTNANPRKMPTLECQLVDVSDAIAYNTHDLDDALQQGLISPQDVEALSLWQEHACLLSDKYPQIEWREFKSLVIRSLINALVEDVYRETERRLQSGHLNSPEDIRRRDEKTSDFSSTMMPRVEELKAFLSANVYRHPLLMKRNELADQVLSCLFGEILAHLEMLPDNYQKRLQIDSPHRVVCDYIASMTDWAAQEKYQLVTGSKT
jgi:dGTPase